MKRSWLKRRSGFKRKPTKLKKQSKQPISKLQRRIWEHCKRIIRARYGNKCFTCPAQNLEGSNWHTGHLWAKASLGAFMKYDLRILRPQCYACNIHRGGMGADFYLKMWEEKGADYMNQLKSDRSVSVKAYDHYLKTLAEYEQITE